MNIKFDDYTMDDFESQTVSIGSEYIMDGATTLTMAADQLRSFAAYLEELEQNGYQLEDVITRGEGIATLGFVPADDELF